MKILILILALIVCHERIACSEKFNEVEILQTSSDFSSISKPIQDCLELLNHTSGTCLNTSDLLRISTSDNSFPWLPDSILEIMVKEVSNYFGGVVSDQNILDFLVKLQTNDCKPDINQDNNFLMLISIACYSKIAALQTAVMMEDRSLADKLVQMLQRENPVAKKFVGYLLRNGMYYFQLDLPQGQTEITANYGILSDILKKELVAGNTIIRKFFEENLESFNVERSLVYIFRGDKPKKFPLLEVFGELYEEGNEWASAFAEPRVNNKFIATAFAYLANCKDNKSRLKFPSAGHLLEKNLAIPVVAESIIKYLDYCGDYLWSLETVQKYFALTSVSDACTKYFQLVGDRTLPFSSVQNFKYVIPELKNINSLLANDMVRDKMIAATSNGDVRLARLFDSLVLNWRFGGQNPITAQIESKILELANIDNSWAQAFAVDCVDLGTHCVDGEDSLKFKKWVVQNIENRNVAEKVLMFIEKFPGAIALELSKLISEKYMDDEIKELVKSGKDQTIFKLTKVTEFDQLPIKSDATRQSIEQMGTAIIHYVSTGAWREALQYLNKVPAIKDLYDSRMQFFDEYTVGQHTSLVLTQFDDQKQFFKLPEIQQSMQETYGFENFDVNKFMYTILLLHDIGKSMGQNVQEQRLSTLAIIEDIMEQLKFQPNEIVLAKLLVDNNILCEWETHEGKHLIISIPRVISQIRNLGKQAGISARTFFKMLMALYVSDSLSYPNICDNYMMASGSGQLKFKTNSDEPTSHLDCISEHFENTAAHLSLDGKIAELLTSKNFVPSMLFYTTNFNGDYDVFEISQRINENEEELMINFSAFRENKSTILEMSKFAILLRDDQYQSDHVEWVIHYRLKIRKSIHLAAILGKAPGDLIKNNLDMVKYFSDFREILMAEVCPQFDFFKFFQAYYYTSSRTSRAFKLLAALSRRVPVDNYVWIKGYEAANRDLSSLLTEYNLSIDQARKIWAAWHAYSIELLNAMKIAGKNEDGTITIMRTETKQTLNLHRIKVGDSGNATKNMLRSAMDCGSIGSCVIEYGTEILLYQKVPLHRCYGGYFAKGYGPTEFWSSPIQDSILFLPEGLPFTYVGTASNNCDMVPSSVSLCKNDEREIDYIMRTIFHCIPIHGENGNMIYVRGPLY